MRGIEELLARLSPEKVFADCEGVDDLITAPRRFIFRNHRDSHVGQNYENGSLSDSDSVYSVELKPAFYCSKSLPAYTLEVAVTNHACLDEVSKMTYFTPSEKGATCQYLCRVELMAETSGACLTAMIASIGVAPALRGHHVMRSSVLSILSAIDDFFEKIPLRMVSADALHIAPALMLASSDKQFRAMRALPHKDDGTLTKRVGVESPIKDVLNYQRARILESRKLKRERAESVSTQLVRYHVAARAGAGIAAAATGARHHSARLST